MNISYDGKRVTFKTEPTELFEAEKSGAKPNTVRILDTDEYHQLRKQNPKRIIIQHQQEIFLRTITHVHATEGVFGKVIVVISWMDEKTQIVCPHSVPVEPGDHNLDINSVQVPATPPICKCTNCVKEDEYLGASTVASARLKELAPVLLPRSLILDLGRHLQGKSHGDFVRELFEMYLDTLHTGGTMHD